MSKKVKVTVMKMEIVDGIKRDKSVTLNLDPEKMVGYTSVGMVKKKVLELVADARGALADLCNLKFDMREFLKEWRCERKKMEEERKRS